MKNEKSEKSEKNEKFKRFDWVDPGDPGERKDVDPKDLRVDHTYQRQPRPRLIEEIANAFNWACFGVVVVMRRASGVYYVVDGQERLLAHVLWAERNPEFVRRTKGLVPCVIFPSTGREQEAVAYHMLNVHREALSPIELYESAVVAKMEPYTEINHWLREYDLRVGEPRGKTGLIGFPAGVVAPWKRNKENCKQALLFQAKIVQPAGRPFKVEIHRGLFHLLWCGFDVARWMPKLQKFGDGLISQQISNQSTEAHEGKGGRCCALGILRVINIGLRPANIQKLCEYVDVDPSDLEPPDLD
jgi:hypothetical protein